VSLWGELIKMFGTGSPPAILGLAAMLLAACTNSSQEAERPYWRVPMSNEPNGPRHASPEDAFRADAGRSVAAPSGTGGSADLSAMWVA